MSLIDAPIDLDLRELRKIAAATHRANNQATDDVGELVPAISYLRVSTKDQATRNGLEEGLSIPAQREAAQRKAAQLGAVIVQEFIEPGESAKTVRRRALQKMLDYIAENPVRYCIINKVDRLARNRLDDAIIHSTLRAANISLVSVTENIDETPSGMLMHGILASMAEFYSLNLAQEVLKGMTQKASIGGTPTMAPLGYLNVRRADGGHEIRDVELDPARADLIRFAFTAYASDEWSLSELVETLSARGLTTRGTQMRAEKPLTKQGLHKILTNPYYRGTIMFRGVAYEGTHEPLVDQETWLKVQTLLAEKNNVGERPQKYDHYLKGIAYCSCGAKLMIECPKDKQGDRYEYFTCSGRRKKNGCTRSAIMIDRIDKEVDRTFGTLGLTQDEAEQTRAVLGKVFDQLEAAAGNERQVLTTQIEKLEAERLKLVQAHYADAIPLEVLKSEQERIGTNLDAARRRLDGLGTTYEDAREGLDKLADLITDLGDLYRRCDPAARRMLLRAVCKKIVIDDTEQVTYVPTDAVEAARNAGAVERKIAGQDSIENLTGDSAGEVSNFPLLVELRGFEPLTSSLRTKRATNCAIAPYNSIYITGRACK